MRVNFSVNGPPPDRTDPGRCADRGSPNAEPLARAAEAIVGNDPDAFPMRKPFGITVVFGATRPDLEGYGPIDPIIEILVDAGMIADERLVEWERERRDPNAGERYTVTVEPARS